MCWLVAMVCLAATAPAFAQDSLRVSCLFQQYTWDSTYSVTVDGNYAYVAAGLSGLQIMNVSNLAAPVRVGSSILRVPLTKWRCAGAMPTWPIGITD